MREVSPNLWEGVRRIVIRSANWVGDAVLSLPAIVSVCQGVPGAEVAILAKPWVAQLFPGYPGVHRTILYQTPGIHEGIGGRWKLARQLKKEFFDLALHLPNSFDSALVSVLAGIPRRAGYNTDGRGILLTHKVPVDGRVKRGHQVEYYLHLVRSLGLPAAGGIPALSVPRDGIAEAESILKAAGGGDGPYVGMSPGAQYGSAKEWFPERFGQLGRRIHAELGGRFLILGSAADRALASRIGNIAGAGAVDLTGKTTLAQAMALIARCRVFVTNDSGLMHVAAALGVPLVAVFGSTDPARTGPLSRNSRVIYKPIPCAPCLKARCPQNRECMEAISVEEVFAEVKDLWESCRDKENSKFQIPNSK
jgi:heptosyltransferase II